MSIPALATAHKKALYKDATLKLIDQHLQVLEDSNCTEPSRIEHLQNACELLSVLIIQDDQDANLWIQRARVQQRQGNCSSALADARNAIRLQPENSNALSLFVQLALQVHAGDIFHEIED